MHFSFQGKFITNVLVIAKLNGNIEIEKHTYPINKDVFKEHLPLSGCISWKPHHTSLPPPASLDSELPGSTSVSVLLITRHLHALNICRKHRFQKSNVNKTSMWFVCVCLPHGAYILIREMGHKQVQLKKKKKKTVEVLIGCPEIEESNGLYMGAQRRSPRNCRFLRPGI